VVNYTYFLKDQSGYLSDVTFIDENLFLQHFIIRWTELTWHLQLQRDMMVLVRTSSTERRSMLRNIGYKRGSTISAGSVIWNQETAFRWKGTAACQDPDTDEAGIWTGFAQNTGSASFCIITRQLIHLLGS